MGGVEVRGNPQTPTLPIYTRAHVGGHKIVTTTKSLSFFTNLFSVNLSASLVNHSSPPLPPNVRSD
jgi:hypothetical protein